MQSQDPYPDGSSAHLRLICAAYDAIAKPSLTCLAIGSGGVSAVGLASQFDNPTFQDYLLSFIIGFLLIIIARMMWAGAWELPHLVSKQAMAVFALVATLGFTCYGVVSMSANLSATAGKSSVELTQKDMINDLENAGLEASSYVSEAQIVVAGLFEQTELASASEDAEISGRGPTGIAGVGSVSNSFAAAATKYDRAASLLERTLSSAETRVDAFGDVVAELRALQIDPDLSRPEKEAELSVLMGKAIGELRALLALDPARSIRTAATSIALGVPNQSQARPQSRARITEISADMRTYARSLVAEADRIAALAPAIPEQKTFSTAERLLQTMWRTPAWTAVALLLDACGWLAVGFRVALYQSLRAKVAEENEVRVPNFVTLDDFFRVEEFVKRAAESQRTIETAKSPRKLGRPRGTTAKKLPPAKSATVKKPRKSKGSEGTSDE